jgi:twitching motility protein PilT
MAKNIYFHIFGNRQKKDDTHSPFIDQAQISTQQTDNLQTNIPTDTPESTTPTEGGISFSEPTPAEPTPTEPQFNTPEPQINEPQGISFNQPEPAQESGGISFNEPIAQTEAQINEPPQAIPQVSAEIQEGSGIIELEEIIKYAKDHNASDIHISTGVMPKMRRFGEVYDMKGWKPLNEEEALKIIYATMDKEVRKEFDETGDADFSFHCPTTGQRLRCNALQNLRGPAAVYRMISDHIMSFDELCLPKSIASIKDYKKGLVLVTGPAGCGKSTTLATLIDMVNEHDEGHILTIEDPVEILHKSKISIVNHREVRSNTNSFARALKSALREDPDSIMIGEMRDLETISLALTAAETGHLVFGTLHTASAHKTITRIIDAFPPGEQGQIRAMISESIRCVISQVLCKRKDGTGQVAAFEIMFGTSAIKNLIRTDKVFQIPSSIEIGTREGMQSLDQALTKLVRDNIIDKEEAKKYARSPEDFNNL